MGRYKKIDHCMRFTVYIPTSVFVRFKEQLYSEVENGIPHGAPSKLVEHLIVEWLEKRGVVL